MKQVIAFAGSSSRTSINKQLAGLAVGMLDEVEATLLDLNDYELPIYSIDRERSEGIPEAAERFLGLIQSADGIVLSLAEHNGAYTTAFKNLFDWMSRIDNKLWNNVPMLLMATSPGKRGGATVLDIAETRFGYMGGNVVATFSLPYFKDNFSESGITDDSLAKELSQAVAKLQDAISQKEKEK